MDKDDLRAAGKTEASEIAQPNYRIRRVLAKEKEKQKKESIGSIARLRASWLARFYRKYLKKYALIRGTFKWIWRNGYAAFVNANYRFVILLNEHAIRRRPIIKLRDLAANWGVPNYSLVKEEVFKTSTPKVFPISDQGCLVAPHAQYTFPEIFVATIDNAIVYGGTNLILTGERVVCHDLYNFETDYTSEELHGRTRIDAKTNKIQWLLHDKEPEKIRMAATFVDACAVNYAHWMTEVLPRIVLFCAEERFYDVPIVVNDGLHRNIMESLFTVAGADREIITLSIGRALAVEKLYATSVAGYVPFERRRKDLASHSHGMFSPRAFERLRNHLKALGQKSKNEVWPEKIYLRRNSGTRKVANEGDLEKFLLERGYEIVEPEKLTFLQQIGLFANAKEIVSPTGAALATAIVCKPGTQVTVLMGKHEDMIYRYWCNLLNSLQIEVGYVLGDIVESKDLGIHGDFAIDTGLLNDLLESFGNK